MSNLTQHERAKYEDAWALDLYAKHSPGETALPLFLDMARPAAGAAVLDAGCGAGKGSAALVAAGFTVVSCDLVIPSDRPPHFHEAVLWHDLSDLVRYAHTPGRTTFDYVYCTDVLEHIPTALTMLVVARLLAVSRAGVFLTISNVPDVMGYWVGKPLHETVQPFVWWRDLLGTVGQVVEARDLLTSSAFLVKAR
jgi:2-polyprenyl-3-methyl-5-hydroxy-6-metoxy-1,4-benzoquinol methylase